MAKVKWRGAHYDPESIEQFGIVFPKGVEVDVPDDHPHLARLAGNPHFAIGKVSEVKAASGRKAE